MCIDGCDAANLANDLKHVLDILAEMIALDQSGFTSSRAPSAAAQFEDDV